MNEPASKPTNEPVQPRSGHEVRDVPVRAIVLGALVLALLVVAVQPLIVWFFDAQLERAKRHAPQVSPLAQREVPPPPRLQSQPQIDYQHFRDREEAWLHSYGWIDRQEKIVRVPIDRAMQLIVERGLPRTEPATSQQEATTRPPDQPPPATENRP